MRSKSSLNFSIQKSLIHPPPLPQALFSVDVGLISKSGLKRLNIRSMREHSRAQNMLNCILLLPKKSRHFSISRMKPISTFILFSEHALPLRIFRCGLCNPQQGAREKGMLRAKGSRYGLKGPSDS